MLIVHTLSEGPRRYLWWSNWCFALACQQRVTIAGPKNSACLRSSSTRWSQRFVRLLYVITQWPWNDQQRTAIGSVACESVRGVINSKWTAKRCDLSHSTEGSFRPCRKRMRARHTIEGQLLTFPMSCLPKASTMTAIIQWFTMFKQFIVAPLCRHRGEFFKVVKCFSWPPKFTENKRKRKKIQQLSDSSHSSSPSRRCEQLRSRIEYSELKIHFQLINIEKKHRWPASQDTLLSSALVNDNKSKETFSSEISWVHYRALSVKCRRSRCASVRSCRIFRNYLWKLSSIFNFTFIYSFMCDSTLMLATTQYSSLAQNPISGSKSSTRQKNLSHHRRPKASKSRQSRRFDVCESCVSQKKKYSWLIIHFSQLIREKQKT